MRHYRYTTLVYIVFVLSLHHFFFHTPKPPVSANNCFSKKGPFFVTLLTFFPGPLFPRGIYSKAGTECVQKDKLLLFIDCQILYIYEEDRHAQGLLIKCPEYTVLIILITVLQLPQELFHYVHKGAFIPSLFFLEGRRIVQQVYLPNELANENFFQRC